MLKRFLDFATMLKHESKMILEGKLRLVLVIVFVVISKILSAMFLYVRLSHATGQFHTPFMDFWGQRGPSRPWLYLFSAWDTGHYVAIATNWYQYPMYVFFPAYPVLCRVIGIITGDFWLSAFMISFFFGLGSVPLFQLICEHYMSRTDAVISTLLAMTFPYVFLFTTVSYTEPLFLFSTLLAWYLYLKERPFPSVLAAMVAALTKTYGIAIVIPMAIGFIVEKKLRRLPLVALSVAALLGWMSFLYFTTGDAIAFLTQQKYWYDILGERPESIQYATSLLNFVFSPSHPVPTFSSMSIAWIIFFGYLIFNVSRVDAKLGVYSVCMYFGLLLFGNSFSFPRYFAFIFPVWLLVQGKVRNLALLVVAIVFFLLSSLVIWAQFIIAFWVS